MISKKEKSNNGPTSEKTFEVYLSHEAEKYYARQDRNTKRKLNKCIENLSENPMFGRHVRRLHGELEGKFRYESGGVRIVYNFDTKRKMVEIKAIRTRGDVYKRREN